MTTFEQLLEEERKLFAAKGGDYDGTGEQFGNFKRVAFLWDYYKLPAPNQPHLVALHYWFKQFDAAMMHLSGQSELKTEGVESRLRDMSIYLKIILALLVNVDKVEDDWKEATEVTDAKITISPEFTPISTEEIANVHRKIEQTIGRDGMPIFSVAPNDVEGSAV